MPTISKLPPADEVSAADILPISQGGSVHAVSVGALLAGVQQAIIYPSPALLGRTSLGPGGPEAISIGSGLILNHTTLVAEGLNTGKIPLQSVPVPSDRMISERGGALQLVELDKFRQLFSAGANISIDANGVIATTGLGTTFSEHLATLSSIATIVAEDRIGVSHAGQDRSASYETLINGITIGQAPAAAAAADSDTIWTGQSGNMMARQTLGELWRWLALKLRGYQRPTIELHANTVLDSGSHGNAVLVCTSPLGIDATASTLDAGFACDVINASSGAVTLSSAFIVPSGNATLAPSQCVTIRCIPLAAGHALYAFAFSGDTLAMIPGSVTNLAVSGTTSDGITLTWQAPTAGGVTTSFLIQYRTTGTQAWNSVQQAAGTTSRSVNGLQAATLYDFTVTATNAAGPGSSSGVLNTATASPATLPGSPTALSTTNVTSNSLTLTWTVPIPGGAGLSYSVYSRLTGQTGWNLAASGFSATNYQLMSLVPGTSYDLQVIATNNFGSGMPSSTLARMTAMVAGLVASIGWNLVPAGTYTLGTGAIGMNVHVSPSSAQVQFGFSASASTRPSVWTQAIAVNTDLWGAYVPTPATPGSWYAWAQGTDGSSPTVYTTPFIVT